MLKMLVDYIFNNNLNIDKTTFLTIIIGQITIYGILLTFFQFVVSYQENKREVTQYLGRNLTSYFIKKNIFLIDNLLYKNYFKIIVVLEVLYKPFITIFYRILPIKLISFMNFIWFVFVIVYFLIFIVIFFQCAKCILGINMISDKEVIKLLINDINRKVLKKISKNKNNPKKINILHQNFVVLGRYIKSDHNYELQEEYNELIIEILNNYIEQKDYEISEIEKKGKVSKNQIAWLYNAMREINLIQEIIDEKFFKLDTYNKIHIICFYFKLLELNFKRAELAKYNRIKCNKYEEIKFSKNKEVFDVVDWKDTTLKLYDIADNVKIKQRLVSTLYDGIYKKQDMYVYYCKECIQNIIRDEIRSISHNIDKQIEFIAVFEAVLKDEYINDICGQALCCEITENKKYNFGDVLDQLNEINSKYLFSYIIIYYSIYRFRFGWEKFDIEMLRKLWKHLGNMRDDIEIIVKRIESTNIKHRFNRQIYLKFIDYIESEDNDLYKRIYDEKTLDVFYIWIIKMCVISQDDIVYLSCQDNLDYDLKIAIVNELSMHDELLCCNNIINWIYYIRYSIFMKQDIFPIKLKVTLRNLLITGLNIRAVLNYLNENEYYYRNSIGMYLLIKLEEIPSNIRMTKKIRGVVSKAFIANDMEINEYITMLENECKICSCEINYVQKEKIKNYLIKSF